jgi:hypothetical protein
MLGAGIPVVEVPPVPEGHDFIVCLTHDVDDPCIRLHRFDHTLLGFLYRALVGSVLNVCRRRISMATLARNVRAVLALPLVHLGWTRDYWSNFDRYLDIERGLGSTFFFLPSKGRPGRTVDGTAPRKRAGVYEIDDLRDSARTLVAAGCDVGVHGIDAWVDPVSAAQESARVSSVIGVPATGVRMHWLYWNERSPEHLEGAGFAYDSSFGYNQTVGFRSGTLQAFKPITAGRLLELPLHIMDTALFYPAYLDLSERAAHSVVTQIIEEAARHGGAVTINWHDRSLGPERLWDHFYVKLIEDLKQRAAWFPTATQAVAWFQRRRTVTFHVAYRDERAVRVAVSADAATEGPGLTLRIYKPDSGTFADVPFKDSLDTRVEIQDDFR